MKRLLLAPLLISALAGFAELASAANIVDMVGDADGFGIGVTDGASFNYNDVGVGDGDGTDVWMYGDFTYSHTYSTAGLGPIISASLEIFTGGQGLGGLSSLYIDGSFVGFLTDGDFEADPYNYAHLDIFDLTPFAGLLDGSTSFTVATAQGGDDGWVLDYSKLTINDTDTSAVPEPTTFLLLGAGLALVAVHRKRRLGL